jgi:acyl-CoA hydrolase
METSQIFKRSVNPSHLNAYGTLHGGWLLQWMDESAAIAAAEMTGRTCVTRFLSEVSFEHSAVSGDIVVIDVRLIAAGTTSLSFRCEAVNRRTGELMARVGKMVFVSLDENRRPVAHGLKA